MEEFIKGFEKKASIIRTLPTPKPPRMFSARGAAMAAVGGGLVGAAGLKGIDRLFDPQQQGDPKNEW